MKQTLIHSMTLSPMILHNVRVIEHCAGYSGVVLAVIYEEGSEGLGKLALHDISGAVVNAGYFPRSDHTR